MGREGVAFTFVTPEEGNELTRIEIRIDRLLSRGEITDLPSPARPAESRGADHQASTTTLAEANRTGGSGRTGVEGAEGSEEAEPAKETKRDVSQLLGRGRSKRYRRAL
jgi:ATP-dependent RNA helicase DeaD